MKDEQAKYLIVDSEEIFKQLYIVKREASFNYWENVYYPGKNITADEIFIKYNIPKEFRKIIIKINIPFFKKMKLKNI